MVEAACGIDIGRKTELVEGAMSGLGSELAEYAKGLVEDNHHGAKLHFISIYCTLNDKIPIFASSKHSFDRLNNHAKSSNRFGS